MIYLDADSILTQRSIVDYVTEDNRKRCGKESYD